MGRSIELESLREALRTNEQHIAIGKILQLGLASDRSVLRCEVQIFDTTSPEDRTITCRMAWDDVGPDCGSVRFPEVDDLVLVAFVDADPNQAYVIKRLTTLQEKIPLKATLGHSVFQALAGKKAYLASDTGVFVGRPGNEGTENLVLGQQLKTMLGTLLDYLAAHVHTSSAPGVLSSPPSGPSGSAAQFTALKASPVNDNTILSDVAFTEK